MEIKQIGRYKIISILGQGGAGTVYKAVDPVLGRDVALKVGRVKETDINVPDKQLLSQGLKEARLAAKFIHPNIAITYDAGIEKNRFYMALEYVDGKGLHSHSQPSDLLPIIQTIEIVYNVCYALEYIHNEGYVHLDVKPANIMLTSSGNVKLMDFGISRLLKEKSEKVGEIAGSVFYMSPEQTEPEKKLDHRSDIFSLGVVLYQLLSGKRPFEGETPFQVLYQIINEEPPSLKKLVKDIPEELVAIVKKSLAKKPGDRFQTTREFSDALLPIIKGKDSAALNKHELKKISHLKKLLFFKHFQDSDLEKVLKLSSWSFYQEKSSIIEGKKNERNIYIIVVGRASVHIGKEIKQIKAGECFCETAVLHSIPITAKFIAETDCVVMSINANILNQADYSIQVKFLREFYMNKTMQLVQANLKIIQNGK